MSLKKRFKKWWHDITKGSKTINQDGKKVTAGKNNKQTGKVVTDRSVGAHNNYVKQAGKAKVKHDAQKQAEREEKARQREEKARQTEAQRKSQAIKIENNQKNVAKVQNGMTQNDVAINQTVSRMDTGAQKKFYDAMKDKKNADRVGVKKDLGKRTAKAEEKAAEQNPFLYNMIRNTSGIDTKKMSERATGEKIDTKKADESVAGRVGAATGQLVQYATTGGIAEGAIKKGLLKGGAKLASKTIAKNTGKKVVKGTVKSIAKKNVIKAGAKKAGNVGASAVAGGLAGVPLDASMALSTSLKDGKIDTKKFAKEFGKNVALDTAFGGGIEAGGKVLGKTVKQAKEAKKLKKQIRSDKKAIAKINKQNAKAGAKEAMEKTLKHYNAEGRLVDVAHASEYDAKTAKKLEKQKAKAKAEKKADKKKAQNQTVEKRKAQKRIAKNEEKLADLKKKSTFKTKVANEEKRLVKEKQAKAKAKEDKAIADWEATRSKGAKELTTRSQKLSDIRKENEYTTKMKADLDNFKKTGKASETPKQAKLETQTLKTKNGKATAEKLVTSDSKGEIKALDNATERSNFTTNKVATNKVAKESKIDEPNIATSKATKTKVSKAKVAKNKVADVAEDMKVADAKESKATKSAKITKSSSEPVNAESYTVKSESDVGVNGKVNKAKAKKQIAKYLSEKEPTRYYASKADAESASKITEKAKAKLDKLKSEKEKMSTKEYDEQVAQVKSERDEQLSKFEEPKKATVTKRGKSEADKWLDEGTSMPETKVTDEDIERARTNIAKEKANKNAKMPTRELDDTTPVELPKSMPGDVALELDKLMKNETELHAKRAKATDTATISELDKQIKDVNKQHTDVTNGIRLAQQNTSTIKQDTEQVLSTIETDANKIKFEDAKSSLTKADIAEGNKLVVDNMRAKADELSNLDAYMKEVDDLLGTPKTAKEYATRVSLYNEEVARFKAELERKASAFRDLQEGEEISHVAEWGKPKEPLRKTFKNIVQTIRTKGFNALATIDDYATKMIKAGYGEEGKALRASANAIRTANARASISISKRQIDYNGKEVGKSLVDIFEPHIKNKSETEIRELDEFLRHYDNQFRAKRRGDDVSIFGKSVSAETSESFVNRMLKKHPEWEDLVQDVAKWEENEQLFRVQSGDISEEMAKKLQAEQPFHVPAHRMNVKGENVFGSVTTAHGSTRNLVPILQDMAEQTQKLHSDASLSDMARDMARCNNVVIDATAQELKGGKSEKDLMDLMNFIGGDENHRTFSFFENGEITTFEVPEEIHKAVAEEKKQTKLIVGGFFNKVGNIRKAILTTLNVSFAIRNGFRDLVEAGLNYNTIGYITHLPRAQKVSAKMMLGNMDDEWLKLYEATGSGDSQFFSFNNYEKLMKELEGKTGTGRQVMDRIERFSSAIEMAPRLACFMDTVEKAGYTAKNCPHDVAKLASNSADEATLNFGRGGHITRTLNANGFIFLNAVLQGSSKAVRNIVEQPDLKTVGKYVAKGAFYGASLASLNHLLNSDNEHYADMNARDKINNLLLPLKEGRTLAIPQSYLATMFIAPFAALDPKSKGHRLDMLETAVQNNFIVLPSEFSGMYLIAPIMQALRNKSWTGAEIVPSYASENTAKGEIVDANTTALSRLLGKLFPNTVSPKKLDYVGQQYGGDFWKAYQFLTSPAKQGSGILQFPFISSFVKDAVYSNSISGDYYKMQEKLNTATSKTKKTKEWKTQSENFASHSSAISDTTSAIKELQNADDKNKGDKIRKLTELRNDMMKDAMSGKAYNGSAKQWKVYKSVFGNEDTIKKLGNKDDNIAMTFYKKEKGKVDDDFYKATQARNNYLSEVKSATNNRVKQDGLGEAIAIFNSGANKTVADAYGLTIKGRTDTADKYNRAKKYVENGGTVKEYIAYKKAITNINYSGQAKEELLEKKVREMEEGKTGSAKELAKAYKSLKASRNGSYTVKAMQLAYMGAGNRVYMVFDIKDRNVQNGINLAAMGINPKKYSAIKNKMDSDGNGYIKKAEAVSYCNANYKSNSERSAVFAGMAAWNAKNPYGTVKYSAEQARKVGEEKGYSNPKATAKTATKYITKTKVLHDVPVSVTYRNGEKQSLQGMTENEVAKLNLNAKGVRSIEYGDREVEVKVKKKVQQKKLKDNSKLPTSGSSSSGGFGYRSYRRSYSRRSGSSGSAKKVAKTSVATVTPPHSTIKEKHEMTDAQIRAMQKKLLAKAYSKYAVKK